MRKVYSCGLQITTVGPNDGNNVFTHFLIANGGEGIVTPDGKLHVDDPKVREAAIKSVELMTDLYKQGVVPPEALSWNDADDNNGFHEKLFVMDFDGTLSTELAMISDKQAFYHDMQTLAPKLKNDGTPMKTQINAGGGFIPKGAKNADVAKDFMKYFMQPDVMNANLKGGLGRWFPTIHSVVQKDPWWLNSGEPCLKPYIEEGVLNPTLPVYEGYTPAWGQANAEQLWGQAHADVIKNGMKVADAVDKAFKRCGRNIREGHDVILTRGEHERHTTGTDRRTSLRHPPVAACLARRGARIRVHLGDCFRPAIHSGVLRLRSLPDRVRALAGRPARALRAAFR